MATAFRPRTLLLFIGDLCFFTLALWVSLFLRTFEPATSYIFFLHLQPFALLFVAWVGVYFIAGLYENSSLLLARRALSTTLLIAQTLNVIVAALFFFFLPMFGIAPKTLLFIYLIVSFLIVLVWRALIFPHLRTPEKAVVVGSGPQVEELVRVINAAHRAPATIEAVVAADDAHLSDTVTQAVAVHAPRFMIVDWSDARVSSAFPNIQKLLSRGVRIFDTSLLYEEMFGRVPLSSLDDRWVAHTISRNTSALYDPIKRLIDIVVAVIGGALSLVFYPFIIAAIKMEDGGPAFVSLARIGARGQIVHMYKFRSMTGNDGGNYGPGGVTKLSVTRVGAVLRKLRLDELPQFWNVLRGDLSLIGPRPESPSLVALYEKEIPYYALRHLIKPGLSGSAQLYHHADPHHAADIENTRDKLSYDLFYLKHRSLVLDLSIILKTIRRLLLRGNA